MSGPRFILEKLSSGNVGACKIPSAGVTHVHALPYQTISPYYAVCCRSPVLNHSEPVRNLNRTAVRGSVRFGSEPVEN
jgi:hypothetical protein